MSDETQETTEQTDEERNFEALRKRAEAAEARVKELSPLAVAKAVSDAGFNPDTPEGKALARLAGDNPDPESVKNLATELGFEASQEPKHEPTPNERAASEFANRQSQLNQVTVADEPEDINSEIAGLETALKAARAARNWDEARAIGEQLRNLNTRKMFDQTMLAG